MKEPTKRLDPHPRHGLARIALAAVTAALIGARATDAQRPYFGFKDDAGPVAEYVDLAERAGATAGAVAVHHGIVDAYGWERFDRAYEVLRERGIRPVMVLSGGRTYTMGAEEWRWLNRELAHRYPGAALQVLSETNHGGFGGKFTPWRYAQRLKQANRAIRSVSPNATVIAAAASPTLRYSDSPKWRASGYTRRLFSHLARRTRIQPAAHVYPLSGQNPIREARRQFRALRRAVAGRPVWVTETGLFASLYGIGPKRQRQTTRVLGMLDRQGACAILYYRLRDDPKSRLDPSARTGALDAAGNPTPLYGAIRRQRAQRARAYPSARFLRRRCGRPH